MTYTPITKLKKFTGKEDDAQVWLNNMEKAIAANGWNNTRAMQRDTEAVTTYLRCFHRNLCQIQAIQADYFTVPQILNQFIRGLHSSILQHICLLHPANLQATITNARDFEAAELKANHAQAVNLVMNRSSDLDSKLKQFSKTINQKLEEYLQETRACHYCDKQKHLQFEYHKWLSEQQSSHQALSTSIILCPNDSINVSSTNDTAIILTSNILTINTYNLSITAIKSYPKLEISDSCLLTNLQLLKPVIEIMPTEFKNWVHTKLEFSELFKPFKDESLIAIFLFKIEEPSETPLFSGTALEKKRITVIYTNVKVNGHSIKLILNSESTGSIIIRQLMNQLATKTPISKINDFSIKVNSIIVPIKVLVMEATQYQTLITRTANIRVPASCDHFKPTIMQPLIKLKEKETKSTWKAYQTTKEKEKEEKNLPETLTNYHGITIIKASYYQFGSGKKREKRKKRKAKTHKTPTLCIFYIRHHNHKSVTDNKSCLACGETLLDKKMWNNIPGQKRMCNKLSVKHLDRCPHDNNEIWQMALAKIEGASTEEIRMIKNNPPESIELN
ncbi:hypothetical protein G9A89_004848 [Geosiphon pyriformis]|nr:hypothetical protein G9A89_004848 [Geosiphon pyriformis]